MDKFLNGFIWGWAGLVALLNFMGIAGAFLTNDFLTAVGNIQEWYSPFNIWTHMLNLILLSPAIGAYFWLERRRNRKDSPKSFSAS
jgi:uncharacterized membrane protein